MNPIIVRCEQCGLLTETLKVATARRIAGDHKRANPGHHLTVARKKEG